MNLLTNTIVTTYVDDILDKNKHIAFDKETYRKSKDNFCILDADELKK